MNVKLCWEVPYSAKIRCFILSSFYTKQKASREQFEDWSHFMCVLLKKISPCVFYLQRLFLGLKQVWVEGWRIFPKALPCNAQCTIYWDPSKSWFLASWPHLTTLTHEDSCNGNGRTDLPADDWRLLNYHLTSKNNMSKSGASESICVWFFPGH